MRPHKALSALIPAINIASSGDYFWFDPGVGAKTAYWYKLQSLSDGAFFGPIRYQPDPFGDNMLLYLPRLQR